MIAYDRRNVIGCGLPSSGKSTYIGALWHLLHSQEVPTRLEYDGLPEDRERLNQLADKWRRCENTDRTLVPDEKVVSIDLRVADSRFTVALPDFSGETWRELWEHRVCPRSVADLAEQSTGVLLFAHADDLIVPLPVATVIEQAEILDSDVKTDKQSTQPSRSQVPYEAAKAPTQAKLVDILQLLSKPPLSMSEPRRLAVVLSAWDLASDQSQAPTEYLGSHLPLLGQYLKYTNRYSSVRVYGVSALGGALPENAQRLRSMARQSDRIRVVEPDGSVSSDLTRPLEWLFE
ncbi:MAG: TRAFAC clade GTPase domain-containing protein [Bacteroidota bacterium]